MKLICHTPLAAPLMTLLKLHDASKTKGVCALITPGSANLVTGMSLGSHALLSYFMDMTVSLEVTSPLKSLTINIPAGGLSYENIEELSGGALTVPPDVGGNIAMLTEGISVEVLIGCSTPDNVLLEEDIIQFVGATEGKVLTIAPLPLLPRTVTFDVTTDGDKTVLFSKELKSEALADLLTQITLVD